MRPPVATRVRTRHHNVPGRWATPPSSTEVGQGRAGRAVPRDRGVSSGYGPPTPLGGCHGHLLGQIELPAGGLSVWALPANFRADLLICWISAGIL